MNLDPKEHLLLILNVHKKSLSAIQNTALAWSEKTLPVSMNVKLEKEVRKHP